VALGSDDVETAAVRDALAEFDVGAATRHVRRDRDRGLPDPAMRDDFGFALVLLRVEDFVADALATAGRRESFSDFSIDVVPTSTGLPLSVRLENILDDRRRTSRRSVA
jgi:hypothetical protein